MAAHPEHVNCAYVANMENRVADINFETAIELLRPCNIKKPRIFKYGDSWCALLGENPMEGVCGFGNTPEAACVAFDKEWRGEI
jgi:hypothetical protein